MAFKLNIVQQTNNDESGNRSERKAVDYDALNKHVVDAANPKKPGAVRSIPGVISSIIDLGIQERDDIIVDYSEQDAKRAGAEEFDDKGKRKLRIPQKPKQQIAMTVDFPQILVDKGQFFGSNDGPLPLRILLNGEFGFRDGAGVWVPIVAKPYTLSESRNDDGSWSIQPQNNLYKLAEACDLLDEKGNFSKENVGDLLGKVAQFSIRVYLRQSGDRSYLTEEIKLAGPVAEGVSIPDFDESLLGGVNFTGGNDPKDIKNLRKCVRNSIKRAKNYAGSGIQKEIEALEASFGQSSGGESKSATTHQKAPVSKPVTPPEEDNWEEDEELLPFSEEMPF